MTIFFFDTSALAKRYTKEKGSQWIVSLFSAEAVAIISELTLVEMFSVLEARQRNSEITPANVRILENSFLLHAQKEYLIIPLNSRIVNDAQTLVTKHPLRAADALQLASASRAAHVLHTAITFICADDRLNTAALAEGFQVENPNGHL